MRRRRGSGHPEKRRFLGWRPAIVVFGVVAVLSVVATVVTQRLVDRQIEARLALNGEALVASIQEGMQDVGHYLAALGGLFQASQEVTADEYRRFTSNMKLQAGMAGIAYMPVVDAADLGAFEEQMAAKIPGYEVFEIDAEGNRVPVQHRDMYFPIQYFEPSDALGRPLGLDAGSPPGRLPYLMEALTSGRTVATPLVPLAITGEEAFIVYRPVIGASGTVEALVGSPVLLADLMSDWVPSGLASVLEWTVRDITDQVPNLAGSASPDLHLQLLPPVGKGMVHTDTIRVASRIWQVDTTPAAGSRLLADRYQTHWILFAGLAIGLMAAAAVYAFSHRSEAMRQVEALTEVLDAKDQFIASVSHELRTPLTGVLGFAEVLRDQAARLSPDERDEMVAAIADEASDLARIIDDLLVMGRAEHGTLTVVAVPVDLRAQAAQVLEGLNLAAEIPIEVTLPDARAVADPGRVRQIIRNLVTNAVVYGGPNIRVVIEPVGETLVVKVIDDGAGIPPEHSEKIFQPYYRSHTTAGRPGSIGLGLSVSRMLAQRMGGDLSHRLADGETIFQLTLPAKAPRSDSPGLTDVTDTPKIRRSRDRSASTRPRTYQS